MSLGALRICSPQHLEEENMVICNIFRRLIYPDWFIRKALFKARKTHFVPQASSNRNKHFVSLPYLTEMNSLIPVCRKLDFNIGFKYTSTIKNVLGKINASGSNAGVYKILCKDCNSVYIGETGRDLATRIKEHKYAIRTANDNNAIFRHVRDQSHRVDWDNSALIYKCNDYKKRKIIESFCIKKYNNYNLCEGTFQLDPLMYILAERSLPTPRSLSHNDRGGGSN